MRGATGVDGNVEKLGEAGSGLSGAGPWCAGRASGIAPGAAGRGKMRARARTTGSESPRAHAQTEHRRPARYLVVISAERPMLALLFLDTREQVAEFDAGSEEAADDQRPGGHARGRRRRMGSCAAGAQRGRAPRGRVYHLDVAGAVPGGLRQLQLTTMSLKRSA